MKVNPSVPKVFLFTDKKEGVPLMWKALSVSFSEKLSLGIVRSNQADVCHEYGVKKFPTVLLTKANEKRPLVYSKEFNYQE